MKIGIGCTTYKRPKTLELWMEQVRKYTPQLSDEYHVDVHIANDGIVSFDKAQTLTRKGIAYRKNECLRALKDCDYIFLFDDDCFPIKEGWAEFFINAHEKTGQNHFIYLKENGNLRNITKSDTYDGLAIEYTNCAGCMMFLTKEVIEKVGAYNPKYGFYGFEHAGYSKRINKAGLTPLGAYTCPEGAGDYIYSMDLDNHLPFNREVNHAPSMSNEIKNIPTYIALNKDIYLQDTEIYLPL